MRYSVLTMIAVRPLWAKHRLRVAKMQDQPSPSFHHSASYVICMWASAWRNQQTDMCAHRRLRSTWASAASLIKVFAVRIKKPRSITYPLNAKRRLWSDWADAQADLSYRWAHVILLGLSYNGSCFLWWRVILLMNNHLYKNHIYVWFHNDRSWYFLFYLFFFLF